MDELKDGDKPQSSSQATSTLKRRRRPTNIDNKTEDSNKRKKEELNCSNISLSVIIRTHGAINANFSKFFNVGRTQEQHENSIIQFESAELKDIINTVSYKQHGIGKLIDIMLSKYGGVCYGNPNIKDFITKTSNYYGNKDDQPLFLQKESFIDTPLILKLCKIFSNGPPKALEYTLSKIYSTKRNFLPSFYNNKTDYTINKSYSHFDNDSKISLFLYENTNGETVCNNRISRAISDHLNTFTQKFVQDKKVITKEDILKIIRESIDNIQKGLQIDTLYYIDLTCNAYLYNKNLNITEHIINILNYKIHKQLLETIIEEGEVKNDKLIHDLKKEGETKVLPRKTGGIGKNVTMRRCKHKHSKHKHSKHKHSKHKHSKPKHKHSKHKHKHSKHKHIK